MKKILISISALSTLLQINFNDHIWEKYEDFRCAIFPHAKRFPCFFTVGFLSEKVVRVPFVSIKVLLIQIV